ncbi:MAG: hypothetical protein RQ736_08425 [Thiogranum sp.]|nr:hypothetical protein [Thiogranum sp.]
MRRYAHKVVAIYPDAATAEDALLALKHARLGDSEVVQLMPGATNIDRAVQPEPDTSRDTMKRQTVTGGAAGTATGALIAGATEVLAPALFVSAPVVGPLIVLGYGALIGGIAGAVRGLRLREDVLTGLVRNALKAGYPVIIIHAASDEVQHQAQAVIGNTMTEQTAVI